MSKHISPKPEAPLSAFETIDAIRALLEDYLNEAPALPVAAADNAEIALDFLIRTAYAVEDAEEI